MPRRAASGYDLNYFDTTIGDGSALLIQRAEVGTSLKILSCTGNFIYSRLSNIGKLRPCGICRFRNGTGHCANNGQCFYQFNCNANGIHFRHWIIPVLLSLWQKTSFLIWVAILIVKHILFCAFCGLDCFMKFMFNFTHITGVFRWNVATFPSCAASAQVPIRSRLACQPSAQVSRMLEDGASTPNDQVPKPNDPANANVPLPIHVLDLEQRLFLLRAVAVVLTVQPPR